MVFVWLGKILAWALLVLGTLRVVTGLFVASLAYDPASYEAATKSYLGSSSSGEAIDHGLMAIAAGICVGLLATIAREVARNRA